MPTDIIATIIINLVTSTIPAAVVFFIAWGKLNERLNNLCDDYERHIKDSQYRVTEFEKVRREHDVMRTEIQHIAARLVVGDKRMDEIAALSRGVAVLETELRAIRAELVAIKGELQPRITR